MILRTLSFARARTSSKNFARWECSRMPQPLSLKLQNSFCALSITTAGSMAGPALKLNTFIARPPSNNKDDVVNNDPFIREMSSSIGVSSGERAYTIAPQLHISRRGIHFLRRKKTIFYLLWNARRGKGRSARGTWTSAKQGKKVLLRKQIPGMQNCPKETPAQLPPFDGPFL